MKKIESFVSITFKLQFFYFATNLKLKMELNYKYSKTL